jgi:hypothetical protein
MKPADHQRGGSALLYVVLTMTVLLAASAAVLRPVSDEYANTFRTASWQEALLAAESGVDLATVQARAALITPDSAWPAPWATVPDTAQIAARSAAGKPALDPPPVIRTRTTSWRHAGEGDALQTVDVQVDTPDGLVDPVSGWQYFRIRSKGTISFGGSRRAGGEKRDLALRKLSLVRDRFTNAPIAQPSVSRTVEIVVRPTSAFPVALLSKLTSTFNNHNVTVDSYDSTDPTKSTNGQWDAAKRQMHGDVATDGILIAAGDAHIYGNVSTNGGTVTGVTNITGEIRSDYYQDIPSVVAPAWTSYTPAIVRSTTTLVASPVKGVARYKMSDISLSGNNALTLQAASGSTAVNYIELWVDGSVSLNGNATILVAKNLVVSIYVAGDTSIGGNGIDNLASTGSNNYERPANMLIYGIQPANGGSQSFKMNGNAAIEASVYAPDADVEIVGGGSNGIFSGSVVGKTIFMNGVTEAHYDEALKKMGIIMGYRIVSWLEDSR